MAEEWKLLLEEKIDASKKTRSALTFSSSVRIGV